jgi:hypothetical protein
MREGVVAALRYASDVESLSLPSSFHGLVGA